MITRLRSALIRVFGGVELEDPDPESFRDRQRRLKLGGELNTLTWRQPLPVPSHDELRRLALIVVINWTDDQASDEEFQASMEKLAEYLVRTAL